MEELNEQNQVEESMSQETEMDQSSSESEESGHESTQESSQAKNFKELRSQADKYKKERDELLRYMQKQQQSSPASTPDTDDEEIKLNPDDLVEGKHLSSYNKKIKKLEEKLKKYESQTTEMAIEQRLKNNYHDFDKVVNQQTVDVLKEQFPDIYSTLATSSDIYGKGVTAYMMIKRLGLVPDEDTQRDQQQLARNMSKPRSLNTVSKSSESAIGRAHAFENGLTEDLKKSLWKEMNDLRKKI